MGTYIYGRTNKTKAYKTVSGDEITINQIKYLCREANDYTFESEEGKYQDRVVTRYNKNWEDKELPQFVIACDRMSDYAEHPVYDSTKIKYAINGQFNQFGVTGHDIYGFGELIGVLKKVKGNWVFEGYELDVEAIKRDYPNMVSAEIDEVYINGVGWKKYDMTVAGVKKADNIPTINLIVTNKDGSTVSPDYNKSHIIIAK